MPSASSPLDGGAPATPPKPTDPAAAAPAAPTTATKPEGLDDKLWDAKTNSVKWPELNTEVGALRAFKAEFDVRQQDVPKDGAYKIELQGVDVPEGMEVNVGPEHPMAKPVMEWAKKHNATQSQVNELVAIQAQAEIAKATQFKADLAAERTKLGDSGQARIDAVKTALTGRLGDRAEPIINGLVTAEQIESFEALLRVTIASAPIPSSGDPAKPDYEKMSPIERLDYAHSKSRKVA